MVCCARDPITDPRPCPSCEPERPASRSASVMVTCTTVGAPPGSRPAASSAAAPVRTASRASTRRWPELRRSDSPVLGLGAGFDIGPIAASSLDACSGVIAIRYSVRSPSETTGLDRKAPGRRRFCLSSNSPSMPNSASRRGRSRRASAGPHSTPWSRIPLATVGTASSVRRSFIRATSRSAVRARPALTSPDTTRAHAIPSGRLSSANAPASGPPHDHMPVGVAAAASWASCATCPAPPCRSDGACFRTHACAEPSPRRADANSPRCAASAVNRTCAAAAWDFTSSAAVISSARSAGLNETSRSPTPARASRAALSTPRNGVPGVGCCSSIDPSSNV